MSVTAVTITAFSLLVGILVALNVKQRNAARKAQLRLVLADAEQQNEAIKKLETESIRGTEEYHAKMEAYRAKWGKQAQQNASNVVPLPITPTKPDGSDDSSGSK